MITHQAEDFDTPGNPSEENNRIFDRFPSRFPAKFKDSRNDFGTDVYLRNASAGGMRIATKERLYLNDNVTLEVDLPDDKGVMTVRGEVAWVKNKDANMWDVGLRFHKIVLMDMWCIYKINQNTPSV